MWQAADVTTTPTGIDRRTARRVSTRAAVGAAVRVAVVLGIYGAMPLSGSVSRLWPVVVLGLGAFVALSVWEARAVLRADRPWVRAVLALSVAVPMFFVFFASTYYVLEGVQPGSMSEPLTKIDAMYLTVTIATTVGFGDITPVTEAARVLASVHMACNLIVLGVTVKVLTAAAKQASQSATAGHRTEQRQVAADEGNPSG